MKIRSKADRVWDWVFVFFCVIVGIVCVVPMLNLLAKSLSNTDFLVRNEVYLLPKGLNFDAYVTVLKDPKYIRAFFWSIFLTLVCTIISLVMTTLCAYPLIFDKLKGRGFINIFITITMFFNAGAIPNYLLMQKLGLLSNPFVLIIPGCLSVYNMIIMRSFFYGIPDSLRESAEIDGATFFQILVKIYVPLSKPVMATLALFYAVCEVRRRELEQDADEPQLPLEAHAALADYICYRHLSSGNLAKQSRAQHYRNEFYAQMQRLSPRPSGGVTGYKNFYTVTDSRWMM